MGGHYEGDGYEVRGCDLALHYYRKARRRRGLGTEPQGSTVASTPAPSSPHACIWCETPLDDLEIAAARDRVVVQLGRICRRCASKQTQARDMQ